jgi:hypothetical protein
MRWIADVIEPSAIRKILRRVRSRVPPASRAPRTRTTDSTFSLLG